jgi:DNA-directed RNA polymerase II subunit RPB3
MDDSFDIHAKPSAFYYDVESVGSLDPDNIIQQGIKALQQKLAAVIQELTEDSNNGDAGARGDDYEPRSPGVGDGAYQNDAQGLGGFQTPFQGGGGASAWGGGATPYGATPYGSGSGWAA